MERQQSGRAEVVPILVRHVDIGGTDIEPLLALPFNRRPIKSWDDADAAWWEVTIGIRVLFKHWLSRQPSAARRGRMDTQGLMKSLKQRGAHAPSRCRATTKKVERE